MLTEALAVTSKCFLEQVHLNCSLKENINCNLLVIAYISESNFFYSPGLLHELISLQELRDREAKTRFLSPQRECRKLLLIHVTPPPPPPLPVKGPSICTSIIHARAWIGILSASVQLDISGVRAANE